VNNAINDKEQQRQDAQTTADVNYAKWQQEIRDARRNGTQLAVCQTRTPKPAGPIRAGTGDSSLPAAVEAPGADPVPAGPVLTWGGVRLYDGAWTGEGGQPVFGPAAGPAAAAGPGAASPYGIDELIAVHGENAKRCSADRLNYASLRARVAAAEQAVEKARQ
jgi:hypothetical protein